MKIRHLLHDIPVLEKRMTSSTTRKSNSNQDNLVQWHPCLMATASSLWQLANIQLRGPPSEIYIYWGSGCSWWVDFKYTNVLVSFHSFKTIDLCPLRGLGQLFSRNEAILRHSPISKNILIIAIFISVNKFWDILSE